MTLRSKTKKNLERIALSGRGRISALGGLLVIINGDEAGKGHGYGSLGGQALTPARDKIQIKRMASPHLILP